MHWVEGIVTVTVLLSLGCFGLYIVALLRMPRGRRPLITPTDRLGHPLPPAANPDDRSTEGEHENEDELCVLRAPGV